MLFTIIFVKGEIVAFEILQSTYGKGQYFQLILYKTIAQQLPQITIKKLTNQHSLSHCLAAKFFTCIYQFWQQNLFIQNLCIQNLLQWKTSARNDHREFFYICSICRRSFE